MLSTLISTAKQIFNSYPILTVLFLALTFLALTIYTTKPPRRFPIEAPTLPLSPGEQRKRWKWNSHDMLLEGYKKFPGQVFQIWTSEGPEIIIPPAYLDELRTLPDTYLSSIAGLAEMFQSRYTTIPIEDNHFGIQFAKTMLTKNLAKILPGMISELHFVLPQHFGSYSDWTHITPHPLITHTITSLTARVFVGPTLCRQSSWLKTTESYSKDVFIASSILKIFPVFSRNVVKNLIPQIWAIRGHNRRAAQIVEAALKDKLQPKTANKHSSEKNSGVRSEELGEAEARDATQGIWELLPDDLKRDYDFQGRGQLGLAAAGIHTTSALVTHCIYSLAQHPEYAPILRQEIEDVRSELALEKREWTVEGIGRLRKLDSFMKETMRLFSGGVTSFRRKVLLPITLSNGIVLPVGSYISAPLFAISASPEIFSSPASFSGFRFLSEALPSTSTTSRDKQIQNHLTSSTSNSPSFGLGKHACPGRHFAALEAKVVLVEMLGRYEFMFREGDGEKGGGGRPGDVVFNSLRIVKPGGEVLIRDLGC